MDIFKILNDLSYQKSGLLTEDNEAEYSPYIINRFLSMDASTVMYSNEMNLRGTLPKLMQYDYYLHAIRKNKRYFKYLKTQKEKNIDVVKEYFGYSEKQAKEVVGMFSQNEIAQMKTRLLKGGLNEK